MRCIVIKCKFKYRPCYSSCKSEPSLLICDIQGQKATTHCAFPSSSSSAAPVTSQSLHLLWLLLLLPLLLLLLLLLVLLFTGHCTTALPLPWSQTPSISPWVNSSAASHWGLTHTPDLTFYWHSSVFAWVDLSWVKIIQPFKHIEPFWRAVSHQMGPAGAAESKHRSW